MEKIIERGPFQNLIELFHECFPQWKVNGWFCTAGNEIAVKLENGTSYLFGTKESGDIYLNRIESQKMQAS